MSKDVANMVHINETSPFDENFLNNLNNRN